MPLVAPVRTTVRRDGDRAVEAEGGVMHRSGNGRAARSSVWHAAPFGYKRRFRIGSSKGTQVVSKNTICLWYDGTALDAARFYAETFPDSAVGAVHRAPGDFPSGKQGDVLTVEFTVVGIPCLGLNGGPAFKHSEAFSFQVATDDQAETDRLWDAIVGNGGEESACGWCKDRWGLSWQITPRALTAAFTDPDRAAAKRAFDAMMQMRKIDIATIEAARRG
jgi:2-polyprenyl-6-hydroxyphenyl methylase/3-demethylubiquinone-9 3-methyltransferase